MDDLAREILGWPIANSGCDLPALISYLSNKTNSPLGEMEVQRAVDWLSARGLARFEGGSLRLTEPDRLEATLYPPLFECFASRRFLSALGIKPKTYVLQDTSRGGKRKTGLLSQPDFTVAVIRAQGLERILEVTTIEVKNRQGGNVKAVYSTAGSYSQISHFPYLACPRSKLNPGHNAAMRATCETQRIGLILFDIEEDGAGGFAIENVKLELQAQRFHPESAKVYNYLEDRLTDVNRNALRVLAKGT